MDLAPNTLQGRFVRLEPLSRAHAPALWEAARAPELWRFTMSRVASRAELDAYVEAALRDAATGAALPFATVDLASGRVAGSTRFTNASARDLRVEIGYTFLAPEFQRTALNTEAKLLMLRHAFEVLGCVRVEFRASAHNAPSRAALRRLGAVEEGILRKQARLPDGTWRDTVFHGVLDREWPEVRARLEARLARGATAG
jgi:RimJ/RimL family protein N-acetyltransferase